MAAITVQFEEELAAFRRSYRPFLAGGLAVTAVGPPLMLALFLSPLDPALKIGIAFLFAVLVVSQWDLVLRRQRYQISDVGIRPIYRPIRWALRGAEFVVRGEDISNIRIGSLYGDEGVATFLAVLSSGESVHIGPPSGTLVGVTVLKTFLKSKGLLPASDVRSPMRAPQNRQPLKRIARWILFGAWATIALTSIGIGTIASVPAQFTLAFLALSGLAVFVWLSYMESVSRRDSGR